MAHVVVVPGNAKSQQKQQQANAGVKEFWNRWKLTSNKPDERSTAALSEGSYEQHEKLNNTFIEVNDISSLSMIVPRPRRLFWSHDLDGYKLSWVVLGTKMQLVYSRAQTPSFLLITWSRL